MNAHRAKYLVVGVYAVAIYAQPRATKDLDILVKADAENAKTVFAALAQFGAPLEFGATTPERERMAGRLKERNVESVAMESAGYSIRC